MFLTICKMILGNDFGKDVGKDCGNDCGDELCEVFW